jgi:uncharacterized protein (DUF1800 family)
MVNAAAQSAQARIRFGLGARPGDKPLDDPRGALKAQLQGPDPAQASGAFDGLPTGLDAMDALHASRLALKARRLAGLPTQGPDINRPLYLNDVTAQLGWASTTDADFRERLVWFWTNHFTVSILQGNTAGLVGPMIREAIRPHVNGNFTDMVLAVERHPAMLQYLMNAESVGPHSRVGLATGRGLNENLGRECMELHTVGLKAGYSQADVTAMANILTGWSDAGSADGGSPTGFKYRPMTHEPGPQTVLGRQFDAGEQAGGEQAGIDALTYLSRYPTTYQLLARKLVTHFVADDPPPEAVATIAGVLQETGGDLAAAAAALVDLPQAWVPLTKLKTPLEFMVSVLRAAPPPESPPAAAKPPAYVAVMNQLGQPVWAAPLPNGWSDQAATWAGSDAMMARIDWAYSYAARFAHPAASTVPADIAQAALGKLLTPNTAQAIAGAATRRDALTLLFASPEFQRR